MKLFLRASICLLGLVFYSCAPTIQTFSDRDTKVDLKQYKTYAWLAPGDSVLNTPRRDKVYGELIMYSANEQLKKKGMVIDTLSPQALFVFDTRIEDKVKYTQSPTVSVGVGFGGPGYYVGGAAPVAGGQVTASTYEEGTLVIDMYDTKKGGLIWRGGARKALTMSDDMEATVKTAVRYIFMRLPLKHKN